jgi:hypothetical protein
MPIRLLTAVACAALLAVALACATGGSGTGGARELDAPSVDILEGTFAQAPYVLEIEVEDVRQTAEFRSDSGELGYVQYSVTGTILEVLKPSEGWEFFSQEVEYRFTREFDPAADLSIAKGDRYLVFLKLADDPPRFWLIGNGAQFKIGPQLSKTIRSVASRE